MCNDFASASSLFEELHPSSMLLQHLTCIYVYHTIEDRTAIVVVAVVWYHGLQWCPKWLGTCTVSCAQGCVRTLNGNGKIIKPDSTSSLDLRIRGLERKCLLASRRPACAGESWFTDSQIIMRQDMNTLRNTRPYIRLAVQARRRSKTRDQINRFTYHDSFFF